MYLNSSRDIDCRCCHSGKFLYRSNSSSHSSSVMGGRDPRGFQSVMDSPDFVNLVTLAEMVRLRRRITRIDGENVHSETHPPICTIAQTNEEVPRIHFPTGACGFSAVGVRMGRPFASRFGDGAAILVTQPRQKSKNRERVANLLSHLFATGSTVHLQLSSTLRRHDLTQCRLSPESPSCSSL